MQTIIFRQYDIRGIVYQDFQPTDFTSISKGFCSLFDYLENKTVLIGMDARTHSEEIKKATVEGILKSGFNVVDIGVASTPMTVFASKYLDTKLAIMITASHNPKEYNGAKFFVDQRQFFGKNITDRLKSASFQVHENRKIGTYNQIDISEIYAEYVLDKFNFNKAKDFKVAFDCGNSVASVGLSKMKSIFNFESHILFEEIDGNFPNHHPDPSKESNMIDLKNFVVENKYDIGFAFDGDADRVGVVLKNGKILTGEELFYVIAKYLLQNNKKDFVVDVLTSQAIIDKLKKQGANITLSQVGNGFISETMRETNSILGMEMSGHICIKDKRHLGNDDGIFNALYFLNIMLEMDIEKSLEEINGLSSIQSKKYKVPEVQKDAILNNIIAEAKMLHKDVNTIDGCRVEIDNGFFCIRKSNTENIIMLKTENLDNETIIKLEDIFEKNISKVENN